MSREDYCKQCGEFIPTNRWSFCSTECRRKYNREQYRLQNPFKGTTRSTTGAISELRVAVDLMSKSYSVFRSMSPSCPCDLVILKDGKLLRVEVRTTYRTTGGNIYKVKPSRDNPENNDIYAWVLPDEIVYEPLLQ